jgi:tetratricopeptide (TPR) repeat protein
MKDEVNANTPPMPSPEPSGDALARALEVMAAQAPFRAAGECAPEPPLPEAGPCPEIGAWLRLAREEALPDEQSALLTHAALCTACLSRMRECRAIVFGDFSAEQIREFKHLSAATHAWRHRFARKLARTPRRSVRLQWLLCSGGAVVAALLALAAVLGWRHANSPEHLLAAAYTEARPFDLRIPGGAFAPVKTPNHVRGEGAGTESAQLLTAHARIERELKQTPTNIYWLQMEARAQLLEQRFDTAIDTLDRLLASGPVTASLLADDGMAYFLRGAATGSENDRATALDTLHRADVLAPNDPVVLFNEAVVMEDRGQVVSAVDTWNRFLRYERDSAWQAEGRRRLSALEEKLNRLKSHRCPMKQHLAMPEAMRALAGDTATLAWIDEALSSIFLLPLLGNLPWPPVVASDGPIGVHFARAEAPSLLLEHMPGALTQHAEGKRFRPFAYPRVRAAKSSFRELWKRLGW